MYSIHTHIHTYKHIPIHIHTHTRTYICMQASGGQAAGDALASLTACNGDMSPGD